MFCFTVGDVIAKRDPLGLFAQSDSVTAEELYDAYGEKIFRLTEEICRDGGWKKAHWTKILQARNVVGIILQKFCREIGRASCRERV